MNSNLSITEFDKNTIPKELLFIKALIPYLDYSTQKTLSTIIRAYEFKSTLNYYNEPSNASIVACSSKPHISRNNPLQDILNNPSIYNTVIPYCPDNIRNVIDACKTYNDMSDLFNNNQQLYDEFYKQLNKLNI